MKGWNGYESSILRRRARFSQSIVFGRGVNSGALMGGSLTPLYSFDVPLSM
jgi:hypothetical protein